MSESLATRTSKAGAFTRRFWFVAFSIAVGPIGALLAASILNAQPAASSGSHSAIWSLLLSLVIAPVLEELAFREFLQGILNETRLGRKHACGVTGANLATSLFFAACHIPSQGARLACLIVFPSLMLGRMKEFFPAMLPVIGLHAWYNACLFIAIH
ncbi:JDVT-CTERM system glutamic-type intramembrane protease [Paraburkholderia ginsengisoli]|uniref:CPBP family intramembrane metalloprotease n=1 Tax=Paraburkholderia ginsengisoli TaxID=311231 RepID=A0A7T4N9Z4_9BURK|nr:JDVT-CTERM system glutamic-type intramembrane protease [Paraburkholderia ginsengisoli]QQC67972.1 CPBP family intramembrane metalloprotease [Paraburkholderia ginsengisoli]